MAEIVYALATKEFIRAVLHAVVLKCGQIVDGSVKADGESCAGGYLAKQDIGKCVAALRARVEALQHGVAAFILAFEVDATAADVDEHSGLAQRCDCIDQLSLCCGQLEVNAVSALCGIVRIPLLTLNGGVDGITGAMPIACTVTSLLCV